jgi:hypothetical protein
VWFQDPSTADTATFHRDDPPAKISTVFRFSEKLIPSVPAPVSPPKPKRRVWPFQSPPKTHKVLAPHYLYYRIQDKEEREALEDSYFEELQRRPSSRKLFRVKEGVRQASVSKGQVSPFSFNVSIV